jgi:glutamate-1-semialdehyde 2,1-aminomutase
MAHLSPEGAVYQAGTLSGNPIATAAGLATLRLADEDVYAAVDHAADVVAQAATTALTTAGVPHVLQANGNMFSVFFTELGAVRNYDDASTQSADVFKAFFGSMLEQGVYLPPSAYEVWFLSAAHDDRALNVICEALPAAARAAAQAAGGSQA